MNGLIFKFVVSGLLFSTLWVGATDLRVRPKNFIVTPSTGPVSEMVVVNRGTSAYVGKITPSYPETWQVSPLSQPIELAAGESKTLSFAIEKGADLKANVYPVSVHAEGLIPVTTDVVCASTPYFKPKIDGKLKEWADAIPISFVAEGKRTTVRSYWNKEWFSLAVDVEEDELLGLANGSDWTGVDAIQFALSPRHSKTSASVDAPAVRYEFLAVASGARRKADACFQLLTPGDSLQVATGARDLSALRLDNAEVEVKHDDGVTHYELAIPMKPMKTLRATAGREYCFSLLVHDPDGTGVRDLGSVMNLGEESRRPLAWCNWKFAKWGGYVPLDNKVEFGFCSSVH